jgi:putative alpha-1,2-mannosidase
MPTTRGRDEDKREASSWYSVYNKSSEMASPGHYSVYLTEPEVQVDLLAVSKFAGLHVYRWTSIDGTAPIGRGLVFDVCHAASEHLSNSPDSCKSASLSFNTDNTEFNASIGFKGSLSGDKEGGLDMFLVAKLSTGGRGNRQPVAKRFFCIEKRCAHRIEDSSVSTTAGILYSHIDLVTGVQSAELRVAISFISLDQAMVNFKDAFQDSDVSDLMTRTEDAWCQELSRITFNISDASEERMIYTALYRTLLTPTQYTEVGGAYMGMDHIVHRISGDVDVDAAENQWYSDLSLWDTFRSQMPWLLLTRPDVSIGVLRSMVEMTKQRSAIPKWPLASSEGNCMIGKHGLASFAEAILSGYGKSCMLTRSNQCNSH